MYSVSDSTKNSTSTICGSKLSLNRCSKSHLGSIQEGSIILALEKNRQAIFWATFVVAPIAWQFKMCYGRCRSIPWEWKRTKPTATSRPLPILTHNNHETGTSMEQEYYMADRLAPGPVNIGIRTESFRKHLYRLCGVGCKGCPEIMSKGPAQDQSPPSSQGDLVAANDLAVTVFALALN